MKDSLVSPPEVLKLMAHEVRWNVLMLLAQSDYRVQELVSTLHLPQNLVSYHLQQLRKGAVVTERRSSADERSLYYSLDLKRLMSLSLAAADLLHPALGAQFRHRQQEQEWLFPASSPRVLFLCTENSARSQMAEALLRHLSPGTVEVCSAGSAPAAQVHPLAVRVMEARGIDMRRAVPKNVQLFQEQTFDAIVTVCDRVREVCPTFPDDQVRIHWSLPDPAMVEGTEEERLQAFEQIAEQLTVRLRFLLASLQQTNQQEGSKSA